MADFGSADHGAVAQRVGTDKESLEAGSIFTPSDLMGAVKAKNSALSLSRGEALLPQEAAQAVMLFEGLVPYRNKLDKAAIS